MAPNIGAVSLSVSVRAESSSSGAPALLRGMRPVQWVKNILVFAAPGAAGALTNANALGRVTVAFVAFCCAASATYLLNDAADVESDRAHPVKRHRPIAAGQLSVTNARIVAVVLAVVALGLSAAVNTALLITVIGYLALTTLYSTVLKHIVIVDMIAVSAGFLLRAVAGGVAAEVPLSGWFYLVVSAGAMLLITGKRLGEFRASHGSENTRKVLRHYSLGILRPLLAVAAGVAVLGYILWAGVESDDVANRSILVSLSVLPFIGATLRYMWLSDQGHAESPDRLLFTDPVTLGLGVVWVLIFGAAIYV